MDRRIAINRIQSVAFSGVNRIIPLMEVESNR